MLRIKKFLLLLFLFAGSCFCLAAADLPDIDYTNPSNWAIYTPVAQADAPDAPKFDVFYIYPTLVASKTIPLMQWDETTRDKVISFAKAQLSGLDGKANLYVPYVRQLEYSRCMAQMGLIINRNEPITDAPPLEETTVVGMEDSMRAFQYYLTHLNHGRPYILLGHDQGAMDLAMVLLSSRNIHVRAGFVSAYLIGMPFKTNAVEHHFNFAKSADDLGVLISWNTQTKDAGDSIFSGPGTYCINPLTWSTDEQPAAASQNPGAKFYDFRTKTFEHIPNYCGAKIDLKKGALIVDPTSDKWNQQPLTGKGICHENDLYFFYDAMIANMLHRVDLWYAQYGKKK